MGDDLNYAQKFTRNTVNSLASLAEMENPRASHEAGTVIDMMTSVQRGAKRLRARHIYSSAQDVLSALHHEDDATLNGRIQNLATIVTKYAKGLDELVEVPQPKPDMSSEEKWAEARSTLNELLPKAPPETADLMSRLMRAPVNLELVQSNEKLQQLKAGNTLETLEPVSMDDIADEDVTAKTITAKPTSNEAPSITLDALMRDVIADALSVARSVGRTISLSYDMGDRSVSEAQANELQSRLGQALSQIIRQALTADRVGHIDINHAGDQLHIMAGTTALRVAIDPKKVPAPKKRITEETEKDLRSQLNALLDPATLQETAS